MGRRAYENLNPTLLITLVVFYQGYYFQNETTFFKCMHNGMRQLGLNDITHWGNGLGLESYDVVFALVHRIVTINGKVKKL